MTDTFAGFHEHGVAKLALADTTKTSFATPHVRCVQAEWQVRRTFLHLTEPIVVVLLERGVNMRHNFGGQRAVRQQFDVALEMFDIRGADDAATDSGRVGGEA